MGVGVNVSEGVGVGDGVSVGVGEPWSVGVADGADSVRVAEGANVGVDAGPPQFSRSIYANVPLDG